MQSRLIWTIIIVAISLFSVILGIDGFVRYRASGKLIRNIQELKKHDVGIVLGASVLPSGKPSAILRDRLETAYIAYNQGKIEKFLVSGDHGTRGYDESKAMYQWLRDKNVPRAHIYVDHAGYRTFDSMFRAALIFKVTKAVIFTQQFHLHRSLFLADSAGIEAVGMISDKHSYNQKTYNFVREFFARQVAFADVYLLRTTPRKLGKSMPISESALNTHKKHYM